ncbi:uncharacterized protein LOC135606732 [Musa acuminata AAA Group]|uniref:uncharacterized protein LOC135606732 n=1 Tax=Musa acuminata AAA Group TaxID=214697 RepID=UPI0031D26136
MADRPKWQQPFRLRFPHWNPPSKAPPPTQPPGTSASPPSRVILRQQRQQQPSPSTRSLSRSSSSPSPPVSRTEAPAPPPAISPSSSHGVPQPQQWPEEASSTSLSPAQGVLQPHQAPSTQEAASMSPSPSRDTPRPPQPSSTQQAIHTLNSESVIEPLDPISRANPNETDLSEQKPEMDTEPEETTNPSNLPQSTELTQSQQKLVEGNPTEDDEDNTNIEIEITEEMTPIGQETESPYASTEEPKNKTEPDPGPTETRDSRTQEDTNGLGGKGNTDAPPASPTTEADNLQTQKVNSGHSQHAGRRNIELAGKNQGASMCVGPETISTPGLQKVNKIDMHTSSDIDRKSQTLGERSHQTGDEVPSITSVNSNVQCINNSILHESSCSQKDPGVYFFFYSKPAFNTRGVSLITTPAQSLTYQPHIEKKQTRSVEEKSQMSHCSA